LESAGGEIREALEDVDDHGAPGYDVALLGLFIEEDVRADYVGAETATN
jgi:hypothetical protein